jgi:hypothetical protein
LRVRIGSSKGDGDDEGTNCEKVWLHGHLPFIRNWLRMDPLSAEGADRSARNALSSEQLSKRTRRVNETDERPQCREK